MVKDVEYNKLEQIGKELLLALGENPEREGLRDTPRRWASWWKEFIEYDGGNHNTAFEAINTDQMVIITDLRVWSICEHHLLPFWCDVSIAYIARDKILGLSKFARIAHVAAHRLQVQERLVSDIADEVTIVTGSPDIGVIARGEHSCMIMRGIKTQGQMVTSVMRGVFRDKPEARTEFLSLCHAH